MNMAIEILVAVWIPEDWLKSAVGRYQRYATTTTRLHGTTLSPQRGLSAGGTDPLDELVTNARAAEAAGFDACIIDCFGDPALDACAAAVRIPVIGVGQAGLQYAFASSDAFSVVTTETAVVDEIRRNAERYGVAARLRDVESIDIPAIDIPDRRVEALERTLRKIDRLALSAQMVLLGCTELAGLIDAVRDSGEVPRGMRVIDPIGAAVRYAETRIALEPGGMAPKWEGR